MMADVLITGREFVRRVRRLAKKRGMSMRLDPSAGKGDHATLCLNGRKTVIPDMRKDIPRGTFHECAGSWVLIRGTCRARRR
jgi:mRNA interferase HicA